MTSSDKLRLLLTLASHKEIRSLPYLVVVETLVLLDWDYGRAREVLLERASQKR